MDHLPLPAGVEKYPYEIPVLCTEDYDNLGFDTYPGRKGFDIDQLRRGEYKGLHDLPQFMQTWLYFGLLSEVLSVKINYKDFTKDGKLTTALLSRYIDEWKARIDALDDEAKAGAHGKVYALLVESARIGRWLTPVNGELPIPPEITLSMQVLVSTLQGATLWIWRNGGDFGRELNEWRNSSFVMWQMYGQGWCPNFLKQCFGKTNVTTMAYISMLDRPDTADHSKCDWDNCRAFNIIVSEYKTKHFTDDCDCLFLDVPIADVREIVRKGAVPGLRLEDGCVVVHEVEDFVAISHVWKDGLGNVGHNSLPKCQLEMLMAKVSEVGGSHFWIDTICVPVERELKAAALQSMEHIYRNAQVVLVLDAALRKASCKTSQLEALIRTFICGWLTRLWTFQEGALAGSDRLRVVFRDGIVSADFDTIDSVRVSYMAAKTWEVARESLISEIPLATLSLLRIHGRSDLMPESNFGAKFMSLWLGCRDRVLTDPGDEYIVFATMLGLDPGRLYLLDKNERMAGFLRMREEWPHAFLFADGPRLRTPGYQWAPSSFLHSWPGQPGNPAENARLGVQTKSGLLVKRQGFVFEDTEAECMLQTFFCKDEASGNWYFLKFQNDANPKDVSAWEQLSPRKGARTGILIADRRAVDGSQWALLVTITREEDSILYADFGCRLVIGFCPQDDLVGWAEMLAPWARPSEEEAKEKQLWPEKECWEMFGRLRRCPDDQMWCIG